MNDSKQWQHRAFGALDWASERHSVIVVDQVGKVIEDFEIEQSALGWKKFREKLQPYGAIPFAIETSQGVAVEQLLQAGILVYPLNLTAPLVLRSSCQKLSKNSSTCEFGSGKTNPMRNLTFTNSSPSSAAAFLP
jgi:hypothetical protein